MKKRLFALMLALVLAVSLLPMAVLADEAEPLEETPVEQSEFDEPAEEPVEESAEETPAEQPATPTDDVTAVATNLDAADSGTVTVGESGSSPLSGSITDSGTAVAATKWSYFRTGTYTLTEDVTVTASIESMGEVTLDLNGHTLKSDVSNVIYVSSGTLTIKDSGSGGQIVGAYCDSSAGVIIVNDGAKLVLESGTLTGGTSTRSGGAGGVYVGRDSKFVMNGGEIKNCKCTSAGGGAVTVVSDGSFTMTGGKISGCSNTGGGSGSGGAGGVCVFSGGSFTMNGGTITGCNVEAHSSNYVAGGVCVMKATFTMNGGTIWLCGTSGLTVGENQKHSGGVYIGIGSTFWANRGEISACYEQEVPATSDTVYRDLVNSGDMKAADGAAGLTVDTLHNNSTNGAIYDVTVNSGNPLINYGEIRSGTFNCKVENKLGIIYDGTFNQDVTNYCGPSGFWGGAMHASIEGGTFNGKVTNQGGWITGGTFESYVYNKVNTVNGSDYPAEISGGIFKYWVINDENSIVRGGDFTGATVSNIFEVTFDLDGKDGTRPATQWRANAPATEPAVPTAAGYNFHYWYDTAGSDSTAYSFKDNISLAAYPTATTNKIVLKAKWLTNITNFKVSSIGENLTYQKGVTQSAQVYIFADGKLLTEGTDYTLGGQTDGMDAGTYVLTVTGIGEYSGAMDWAWRIARKSVDKVDYAINGGGKNYSYSYTYNGAEHTPTIVLTQSVGSSAVGSATTLHDETLVEGTDYTLSGALSGTDAGTYTVTVTGIGNYTGTATITWTIEPAATTCTAPTDLTATYGQLLMDVAFPTVENGTWAWKNPTQSVGSVGTNEFEAVYTPNDSNYQSVTETVNVTVGQRDIGGAAVSQRTSIVYDGTVRTPVAGMLSVMLDGRVLNTENYDVTVVSQTNAGTYTMIVTGKGNYKGTVPASWAITPKPISVSSATAQDKTYDGTATATAASVTFDDLIQGQSLALGTDYTAVASFANADAGEGKTVTVTVTLGDTASAKNYTLSSASADTTATIEQRPVTLTSADRSKPYDGEALTNDGEAVTVTAGSMAAGEAFDFRFTGTQTNIGSSKNTFAAKNSATANVANYKITYHYGKLTVTVAADVAELVEDINAGNASTSDKKKLEEAKETIEDILDNHGDDLTEDEKAELEQALARVDAALEAIERTEQTKHQAVKTGDEAMPMLYLALALSAAAALVCAAKKKEH